MRICLLALCVSLASPVYAYEGVVKAIRDGDTCFVQEPGRRVLHKIRLADIDAPEIEQPYGREALAAFRKLAQGKTVEVQEHGVDIYGREVATLYFLDDDNLSINEWLVVTGNAWFYEKYSDNESVKCLEDSARVAKRGLWSQQAVEPPWIFRNVRHKHSTFSARPGVGWK